MDTITVMDETDAELIKALSISANHNRKGMTRKEISAITGWGEKKTLRWLTQCIQLELMDCFLDYIQYNNKIWNKVTVYSITEKGKAYANTATHSTGFG